MKMKLLIVFALVFACAYADLDLTEWKAEYGAFPTGAMMRYAAPLFYPFAPKPLEPFKIPEGYKVMYDPLVPKALMESFKIPEGYKVMYDPLVPKALMEPFKIRADNKVMDTVELKTLDTLKIPAGYRATFDPENFNDVFGFYPEYKK